MSSNAQPRYLQETNRQKQLKQQKLEEMNDEDGHKFVMLNTRMLDNHWDKNIHQKHWNAPGVQPGYKYTYTKDSGLGYKIESKFEQQIEQERSQLQQKHKETTKNFHDKKSYKYRPYKELENLNEDEVVITIEYCTNCKTHNSTTRHDEQKYLNQALSLQKEILKCFPVITVYLKPNVYDERDKSIDTLYIRQRVGAFDVQIGAGQKDGQPPIRGVLHSKLKSGKWADHANILSQIRDYMSVTDLRIGLSLQDFNLQDVEEYQLQNPKVNKLCNIQVSLRPKREKVVYNNATQKQKQSQQQLLDQLDDASPTSQGGRPTSALSRKSAFSRPKSAVSNHSNKSRTQSQYGGGNAQVQEYDTSKDKIVKSTNPDGTVVFENIPYDVYYIEIEETNEFKQLKESVDIFEFIKNDEPLDLHFDLKHLNLTFLKLTCAWGVAATPQEAQTIQTFAGQDAEGQEIRLIQRGPLERSSLEIIPIRDGEEIVDETYDDTFSGSCEVTLLPGREYQIRISKFGYQTLDQRVELQPGVQELEFCVEKRKPQPGQSAKSFRSTNSQQQQPSSQRKQQQQQGMEERKTYQGSSQRKQDRHRPTSGRPGSGKQVDQQQQQGQQQQQRPVSGAKFLTIYTYDCNHVKTKAIEGVSIIIKERKLNRNNNEVYKTDANGLSTIQLQNVFEGSLEISHPDYITMVEEYGPNKFDLKKQQQLNFPLMKKTQEGEMQIRVLTNSGKKVLELSIIATDDQLYTESNGDIQIDNSFTNGNGTLAIQNIQNKSGIFRVQALILEPEQFNPQFVKLFVIYDGKQQCIQIPKNIQTENGMPEYWDIGFVNAPTMEFVEINAPCVQAVDREQHLYEYQKLLNFIQSSKNVDLKQLLGFNGEQKVQVHDDVQQDINQIFQSLQQYSIKASPSLVHLLASGKCLNGLYSFQKLNNKFTSIQSSQNWNIEQQAEEDDYEEDGGQFENI